MAGLISQRRYPHGRAVALLGTRTLVSDTFTRADSATTLGTADTGQAWVAMVGTWGLAGGQAYLVSATADAAAVVDAGVADCTVRVTIPTAAGAVCGLTFRLTDASNYWRVVRSGVSNVVLQKTVAGARTTVATATATIADGAVLEVRGAGSAISVTLGGVLLTALSVSDAFNATATKHGLHCNNNATTRFDGFRVTTA